MNIGVIQTAFIGDVVLTTPLIRALKEEFSGSKIHFIGVQAGCDVLEGLLNLKVHVLDKSKLKGVSQVMASLQRAVPEGFDVLLCVHRSFRSLLLARMIPAKRRLAFSSWLSILLGFETVCYPDYDEKMHYADKPMVLFKKLTGKKNAPTPKPFLQADIAMTEPMKTRYGLQTGFILVSPFSVWGTKNWPADRFTETVILFHKKIKKRIVITGGQSAGEKEKSRVMSEKLLQNDVDHLNLTAKTTLKEFIRLISMADLVLCNDSAAVHVAAAFDRPAVAVFGPTVKKWGFFPLSTKNRVVEVSGLDCRPCSLHGQQVCPKKHFRCMLDIQPAQVLNAIEEVTGL